MRIEIVYYSGCDVTNFEIKLIFLIKLFFHMTKKSKQTFKYFENERAFSMKGLLVAKNCV